MYKRQFNAQMFILCAKPNKNLHNLNICVTFAAQNVNINFIILSKK